MVTETFERKYARLESRVDELEKQTAKLKETLGNLLKDGIELYEVEGEKYISSPPPSEDKAFIEEVFGLSSGHTKMGGDGQEAEKPKEEDTPQTDVEMVSDEAYGSQTAAHRQPVL